MNVNRQEFAIGHQETMKLKGTATEASRAAAAAVASCVWNAVACKIQKNIERKPT